jgi:hypothetical protein
VERRHAVDLGVHGDTCGELGADPTRKDAAHDATPL